MGQKYHYEYDDEIILILFQGISTLFEATFNVQQCELC
jgi:hypothetical protein